MKEFTIIKVVQVTHDQSDARYGAPSGMQCSCMSLISVTWTLIRSPSLWDKFRLDCILDKTVQLFEFIGKIRRLDTKDCKVTSFS